MVIYGKLVLTAIFWGGTFAAARVVAQDVGPFSASFLFGKKRGFLLSS
jgi:hypothetical protein